MLQAVVTAVGSSPAALFAHVRDRTAPAFNRYALQAPAQVLASGRGNSAERARLLGALLVAADHPVRFQTGELDDEAAAGLIAAALPQPVGTGAWPADVPLSRPATDPVLLEAVRRHTWVQVLTDGRWLDLDPGLPDAAPGAGHGAPSATFYRFAAARLPRLELTLEFDRSTAPGDFEELVWWDGPLEELAGRPLALRIYPRIGSADARGEGDSEPARRLVDPLAGADEATAAPTTVTTWRAELWLADRVLVSADLPESVAADQGRLRTLRLRSRILVTDEHGWDDLRVLAAANAAGQLPLFQRHSLLFATGAIQPAELEQWLTQGPPAWRAEVRGQVQRLRRDLAAGSPARSQLLDAMLGAEQNLGGFSGHLLNLAYGVIVDQLSADLAGRLGVHSYFEAPRLIISSVLTEADGRQQVALDLRRDRVAAIALPGQPQRLAEVFQFGRGVISSVLEGRLVTLATGAPALTTAVLMRHARDQGIPVRLYSARERAVLGQLPLPAAVQALLDAALGAGQVVMLPSRPVQFAGTARWGWWQIDPVTRATVGVLDSGLHQAVVERTLIETKGVLSDGMAAVIGAISGATDTQFAISAMVLKHGDLTAAALAEAKSYMAELGQALCQQLTVEAKLGGHHTLASAAVEMEGCFRYEAALEVGAEGGASLTLMDRGWCEAFQRGFSCAAMTILNAYGAGQ